MKTSIYNPRGMGAIPLGDGTTQFRVWAPHANWVSVVGEFNNWDAAAHPLTYQKGGMWARTVEGANAGQQYQFEITNGDATFRKNDAYARAIHEKSALSVIYDDSTYQWQSKDFKMANWNELVLYEIHVGTFAESPEGKPGGFEQVVGRMKYLQELGVNALEIMPPMAFPGERSWGYNLTNPFAVEASYGGPEGFKRLVDVAHQHGIAIILDVVINHFGPDNLDLWQYDGWARTTRAASTFTTITARGRRGARTGPTSVAAKCANICAIVACSGSMNFTATACALTPRSLSATRAASRATRRPNWPRAGR